MELRNINTFLHIAELHSFSSAARELGYSQSAVSAQISQLETELGTPLFDRVGKTVRLTDAGQTFQSYARTLLITAQQAKAALLPARAVSGTLRVALADSVCSTFLPDLLQQFHALCPQVELVLRTATADEMLRLLSANQIDLAYTLDQSLLSKSEVFAENKLFATLDTTVRKVIIDNLPFLLSDTVGFIRKLPTDLVESFKSTLDEVREADLLVHVVDISHPGFEEQIEVVNKTLAEIGGSGKPMILVFNKIDAYTYVEKAPDDLTPRTKENLTLEELMKTWMAKMEDNCLFISARERINIDELKNVVYQRVKELHVQKYPYNDFLYQTYEEEEEE